MSTQETNIPQAIELPEKTEQFGGNDLNNFPQVKERVGQTEGVIQFQLDFKNFDESILRKHEKTKFAFAYDTKAATRGLCLIINNKKFKHLDERIGTDVDCANLNNLFTQLGYKVKVLSDQTANEMKVACRDFILDPMHEFHVSCVLIILSHGTMGRIFGSDGRSVEEKSDILDHFNDPNCGLRDKPKLYIVQACRTQLDTEVNETHCNPEDFKDNGGRSEVSDYFDLLARMRKLNNKDASLVGSYQTEFADLLIAHSTLPGYASWRNKHQGSWFVQSLVLTFMRHFSDEHVADMMVMVNDVVSKVFGPMPHPTNQLRKKFYFFPLTE